MSSGVHLRLENSKWTVVMQCSFKFLTTHTFNFLSSAFSPFVLFTRHHAFLFILKGIKRCGFPPPTYNIFIYFIIFLVLLTSSLLYWSLLDVFRSKVPSPKQKLICAAFICAMFCSDIFFCNTSVVETQFSML